MQVASLCMCCTEVDILPCLQGLNTRWRTGATEYILYRIQIHLNAAKIVGSKFNGMRHRLPEVSFFVYENVFVRDDVNKWIVDDVNPDILRQVIFVHGNGAILLQKTIVFRIPEAVAAVAPFRRPVVGMGIEINAINLW